MVTFRFVDSVSTSAAVRLNLNDGTTWSLLQESIDLSPPELRRASESTMLVDGSYVSDSSYENRVLTFQLHVEAASEDLLLAQLQLLARQLDRADNVLEMMTGTVPVFFRTLRSPSYQIVEHQAGLHWARLRCEVLAEPFGVGAKVTQSVQAASNDPAAANGCFIDVTGVLGDVDTPGMFTVESPGGSPTMVLAVRHRGTPSNGSWLVQAESMTVGTDTTVQANDPLMSGAGSNYTRTTFATASSQNRLQFLYPPGSVTVDHRGLYRAFARLRSSDGTSVFETILKNSIGVTFDTKSVTPATLAGWYDLGKLSVPVGADAQFDGYGAERIFAAGTYQIFIARSSGTGTLDADGLLLLPADEHHGWAKCGSAPGANLVWDGPNDVVYSPTAPVTVSRGGDVPMLTPNQTNRLFVLPTTEAASALTIGTDITVAYYPLFLYLRP